MDVAVPLVKLVSFAVQVVARLSLVALAVREEVLKDRRRHTLAVAVAPVAGKLLGEAVVLVEHAIEALLLAAIDLVGSTSVEVKAEAGSLEPMLGIDLVSNEAALVAVDGGHVADGVHDLETVLTLDEHIGAVLMDNLFP